MTLDFVLTTCNLVRACNNAFLLLPAFWFHFCFVSHLIYTPEHPQSVGSKEFKTTLEIIHNVLGHEHFVWRADNTGDRAQKSQNGVLWLLFLEASLNSFITRISSFEPGLSKRRAKSAVLLWQPVPYSPRQWDFSIWKDFRIRIGVRFSTPNPNNSRVKE
jgi:hypothetical protein